MLFTYTRGAKQSQPVVTRYAHSKGCDGVVCGHIHTPAMHERNGIAYFNTGDWVENCTALVEYYDGRFEIIHRPAHYRVEEVPDDLRVEFEPDDHEAALLNSIMDGQFQQEPAVEEVCT